MPKCHKSSDTGCNHCDHKKRRRYEMERKLLMVLPELVHINRERTLDLNFRMLLKHAMIGWFFYITFYGRRIWVKSKNKSIAFLKQSTSHIIPYHKVRIKSRNGFLFNILFPLIFFPQFSWWLDSSESKTLQNCVSKKLRKMFRVFNISLGNHLFSLTEGYENQALCLIAGRKCF